MQRKEHKTALVAINNVLILNDDEPARLNEPLLARLKNEAYSQVILFGLSCKCLANADCEHKQKQQQLLNNLNPHISISPTFYSSDKSLFSNALRYEDAITSILIKDASSAEERPSYIFDVYDFDANALRLVQAMVAQNAATVNIFYVQQEKINDFRPKVPEESVDENTDLSLPADAKQLLIDIENAITMDADHQRNKQWKTAFFSLFGGVTRTLANGENVVGRVHVTHTMNTILLHIEAAKRFVIREPDHSKHAAIYQGALNEVRMLITQAVEKNNSWYSFFHRRSDEAKAFYVEWNNRLNPQEAAQQALTR